MNESRLVPTKREQIDAAMKHLRAGDPIIKELIRRVGPFRMKLRRDRFQALVRAIVSQQISTAAAREVLRRLNELVAKEGLTSEVICRLDTESLRSVGLSRQKASYLRDLAEKTREGQLRLNRLGRLSDEQAIEEMTTVKGVGRWTAQMLLMFSLGRLDVLPHDDFGIRSAIRNLYELDELPDASTSQRIAEPWRPYATVACWYLWRSHEL